MEEWNLDFLNRPSELSSLQDLSAVAATSLFWSSKEIKKATEEVLDRHYILWRDQNSPIKTIKPCLKDLSVKISDTVSRIFNQAKGQVSLPQKLKTEIKIKLLEKATKRLNWILYLIKDLKLNYKAAEKIYWTADGQIDEDKIFRNFWSDQLVKEPVNWKIFDDNLTLLQYLACFFGQEEFISLHQSDYIDAIKPLAVENNDIGLTIMKSVIAYYNDLYFLISNSFQRAKFYILNISTVGMLPICIRFCFHKPFVFFWNRLDATERFNYLETQSQTRSLWRNKIKTTKYATEKNLKIVLFLMEQMNERQKYNFILNNFSELILILSNNKNCKTFCMALVEHFLPLIHETEKTNLIKTCIVICNQSNQCDIVLEILNHSVKNAPMYRLNLPDFIFTGFNPNSPLQIIKTLFENFNIPALKFIIKNESSESRKKDLISIGTMKFRELIRYNNFKLMDNFLDEVISSEAEKYNFKQDYNFLGEWIYQCRFDIVNNVLIWMYGAASMDIKMSLRNICCSSMRRDYEGIQKLLIWFFNARGPLINSCQSKLELLYEFCSDVIYNLWFPKYYTLQNRAKAPEISTKILIFSFFSEKEIQNFKTNVLGNEERCIKFFCEKEWNNWKCHQLLSDLDDFLKFCNLSKEKEDCIKSSLNEKCRKLAFKNGET